EYRHLRPTLRPGLQIREFYHGLLGGVAWDREVDLAVSCCILNALLALTTVAKVYRTRLHIEELAPAIKNKANSAQDFLQEHLVKPVRESRLEGPSLADAFDQLLV